MLPLLRTLFSYNLWAQDQVFVALDGITEDDFLKDLGDGVGSIRDKLVHIFAAESIWFDRLHGSSAERFPESSLYPTRDALLVAWRNLRTRFQTWFEGLDEGALEDTVAYRNLAGREYSSPVWQILSHVLNHGTYHRGQVASLIRRVAGKPPATDLILYFRK